MGHRDQPGDWHAICLYFASHKPLHSPVVEPSAAPHVYAYPSHFPDHHTGAAAGASLDRDIWLHYNGGRQIENDRFKIYDWCLMTDVAMAISTDADTDADVVYLDYLMTS